MINLDAIENWDIPLFPVSVAAQAAGMDAGALRNWIQRGRERGDFSLWDESGNLAPRRGGATGLLSLRTVLHIAATAVLVRKGIKVTDAYQSTICWAHSDDMAVVWGDGPVPPVEREPAGLYPAPDQTFLVHYAGTAANVFRVPNDPAGLLFKWDDLFGDTGATDAPTIVWLNSVDARARQVCIEYLRDELR